MSKKKNYQLLIGSNNKGKLREIRDLLPNRIKTLSPLDYKIKSPKDKVNVGKILPNSSLCFFAYRFKKYINIKANMSE